MVTHSNYLALLKTLKIIGAVRKFRAQNRNVHRGTLKELRQGAMTHLDVYPSMELESRRFQEGVAKRSERRADEAKVGEKADNTGRI